ncbi:hypothetical protein AB0M94_36300 [Streptomyces xanthochromogenes]|uniref:FXSXX-COOH protein n=1 Tax=Streptomyces xanthochromogenes TaxID=67384 RepID=A0ABQ3AX55_9ACTN|nr:MULTISPECIES: hypothetical protein [Streptomyces]MYV95979.1 hypothetical protein [Streptomyces sp. SID1034]GGY70606.1 hypothetical protein GCM10010326_76020 [Streptomyces xanthochromogenes]
MNRLVSAATIKTEVPSEPRHMPLAARAAMQHDGRVPSAVRRVTEDHAAVPSASAFQSAL